VEILPPVPLRQDDDAVAPELTNRAQVEDGLLRTYPRALQAAGIGGEVVLRVDVDDLGRVDREGVSVLRADRTELGFAAAAVGPWMHFRPALAHDTPVPVTVDITVRFTPEP
jgi:TonB family protein